MVDIKQEEEFNFQKDKISIIKFLFIFFNKTKQKINITIINLDIFKLLESIFVIIEHYCLYIKF